MKDMEELKKYVESGAITNPRKVLELSLCQYDKLEKQLEEVEAKYKVLGEASQSLFLEMQNKLNNMNNALKEIYELAYSNPDAVQDIASDNIDLNLATIEKGE